MCQSVTFLDLKSALLHIILWFLVLQSMLHHFFNGWLREVATKIRARECKANGCKRFNWNWKWKWNWLEACVHIFSRLFVEMSKSSESNFFYPFMCVHACLFDLNTPSNWIPIHSANWEFQSGKPWRWNQWTTRYVNSQLVTHAHKHKNLCTHTHTHSCVCILWHASWIPLVWLFFIRILSCMLQNSPCS